MIRIVFYWLLLVSSATGFAQNDDANGPAEPLDPAYESEHAMVVFNHASSLFVSNLPSYRKPHNAQLIYKITPKDPALIYLTRDADLVTLRTQSFNLQKLIRGESLTVKADVYIGHFAQGGSLAYEQVDITFSEQKYLRVLEGLDKPNNRQKYDTVELGYNSRALIHQIQGAPSYDHLILLFENNSCITDVNAKSSVPAEDMLNYRLSFCGSMKSIYYQSTPLSENAILSSE